MPPWEPSSVLACRFQADLLLVHSPHASAVSLFAPPPTTRAPDEYLAQVAGRLQGEGLQVRTARARGNTLNAATLQSADLIVLPTRSHRDLEALLHPSRNTMLCQSSAPS